MKKFKKLILGAVTAAAAAVMSLGAVPDGVLPGFSVVASAADTYLNGGTADNPTPLVSSDSTDTINLGSGYYILNDDAVFNGEIEIHGGTVIINLNGHTLQATFIDLIWGPTVTINGGSGNAKGKLKLTSGYNGVEAITFSWATNLTIENTIIEAESCSGNSIGGNQSDDSVTLTNVEFTANSKSMWFKGTTVLDNCSNVPAIETVGGSLNVRNGTVLNGFLNCQGTTTTITGSVINGGISNYESNIAITDSEIKNCTVTKQTYAAAEKSTTSISKSEITGAAISNSTIDSDTVIKSTTVTNSTIGDEKVTNDTYDENGNTDYKITFYKNNGTTDVYTTQTVENDNYTKATKPTDPTRTGYTFKGWYNNEDCTGDPFNFENTTITGDTTLYAKWLKHIKYIDADGNEVIIGDDDNEDYTLVTSSTTSWSAGWYVVNDDVTISGKISATGNVNLILVDGAKLTVTGTSADAAITVGGNFTVYGQSGGSGTLEAKGTGNYSPGINVVNLTINGGTVISIGNDTSINAAEDVVINGGTVTASSPDTGIYSDNLTIKGGNVTALGTYCGVWIDNSGAVVLDWTELTDSIKLDTIEKATSITFTKPFVISGTNTLATADNIAGKTLVPAYKVTFKAEGIEDFYGGAPRTTGKVTAPTAPTREGYTFGGWYTTAACETEFDFANTTITEDTTIYAKWRTNLTADNVTAAELTYNSAEQTNILTVKVGEVTLTAGTDYTVTYSPDEVKNAGEYTATITGIGNYAGTVGKTFTVEKAIITPTLSIQDKTYDGNEITYTIGDNPGGGMVTLLEWYKQNSDNTWRSFSGTPKDAGKYRGQATIAETDNYFSATTNTAEFTISKAAITPTVSIANWVYGTTASTPRVTGNPGNGAVTYEYKAGGGTYSSEVPTAVGSYTIKAVVAESANYFGGEATSTFSITKAPAGCTAPAANSLTYTGEAQALVTEGRTNDGTMRYSSDGTSWSTTVPTGVNAGSYTVYYKVIGDANHSDSAARSVYVTIAKAASSCTAPTANSLTYTGSALALVSAGSTSDGEMQYSLDGTSWNATIPTATNAGNYTVYYKVIGDGNHNDTEPQSVDVTIGKASDKPLENVTDTLLRSAKSISISVASAVPADAGTIGGYAVNGTASTTGAVTVSNAAVSAAGLVTATLTGGAANDTITVPVKITAQNYDCTISVIVTLTELADPVFTAPTAKTLTYNGTVQELVTAGIVTTGGAMQYSTDGASWSTTVPTAANAGSYTVYYKIDETDEVNGVTSTPVNVSIARKAAVVTADNKTRVVAAPDPELTATVTGLVGSDTISYTLSREAGEKVGIYTITPSGDAVQGNYTVTYQPGTLTIADVYVDGKPVEGTFIDILKNAKGDTVTITLGKDVSIEKLTFPKEKDAKEIIIDGNGYTIGFTGSASIKPNQKLTLVNVNIEAVKNNKPQNITITSPKGGLTLENVTLNGKKATITASSGDLTLGNVAGNELTVKGAAKTMLTANGEVGASSVTGFGTAAVNGTLNVTKTLSVKELIFADDAVLEIASGAAVTVKKRISGNGTIDLASVDNAQRRYYRKYQAGIRQAYG